MSLKKVTFQGWKNCIEIVNGNFKLIVTTEVGPRVIGAFYGKSPNLFHVDPKLAGKKGPQGEWVNYGGHRLWHSPETKERTYEPDNGEKKVDVVDNGDGSISFLTPTDPKTGIAKSLTIAPAEEETFQVIHTIRNNGVWEIEASAWALSVMAPGGTAVAPQNIRDFQLLPTSFFAVWPYTNMSDPRLIWGEQFLIVKQDPKAKTPLKVGYNCEDGWISYVNNGIAFVKQFIHDPDADYPDNGCSAELYTNSEMLEAETLSPLELLAPGDEICHMELWSALPADKPIKTEADAVTLFGDCCCDDDDCCCDDDDCCCDDDDCCCCHEEVKPAEKSAKAKSKKADTKKKAAKKTSKK